MPRQPKIKFTAADLRRGSPKPKPPIRLLEVCAKCSDMFSGTLLEDNKVKGTYDGYVPDWFPNSYAGNDGDYVILTINVDTGELLNWKRPTQKDLKIFVDSKE